MNADRLLAYYDQVANAPDSIVKLRRLILNLAVRGKLVRQDANDEPASRLVARVSKEIPTVTRTSFSSEQWPYDAPQGWLWTRLGQLVAHSDGGWSPKTQDFPRSGNAWGVLKVSAVSWDKFRPNENKQMLPGTQPRASIEVKQGDFLISRANTSELVARAVLVDAPVSKLMMSDKIVRLHLIDECNKNFIIIINNHADFARNYYTVHASGVSPSMKNVSRGVILGLPVPLPPLAEQHRIVTKVDELMGLCDRLESARMVREAARDRLVAANLSRLNAPDPKTSQTDARFTLDALPALTARPDQIKALRHTILNLAVRGKLVRQNSEDEPALELLKRVEEARKSHVTNRMIRGAEPPAQPCAEMEGFELPPSWQLCSLGQITLITDPNPSHRYPDYTGGTVPLLSTREFKDDIDWDPRTAKLTTNATWEAQREICDFSEGDIVFARKGRLGLPRPLPKMEKFTFSHTLFVIKPMGEIYPSYLLWALRRGEVISWLTKKMNQNTGVPTLGKAKTERLPIPLPPLAEQYRIVARIGELMALCDRLEASLTTAADTRRRLLDALLAEALAPDEDRLLEAAE